MKKLLLGIVALIVVIGAASYSFISSRQVQVSEIMYDVGIFSGAAIFDPMIDSFKQQMTSLGHEEGKNITYHIEKTNADPVASKAAIQSLIAKNIDALFVFPTEAALIAKAEAKGSIPIVFAGDPEGTTLIESIRNPGENLTGVRFGGSDTTDKRLELLAEIGRKKIYVPYQDGYPTSKTTMDRLRLTAQRLNVELVELAAKTPQDIVADMERLDKANDVGIDAILITPNPLVTVPPVWVPMTSFAEKNRLPIAGGPRVQITSGAAFTLFSDSEDVGKLAADQANKILGGLSAGSLPVATPLFKLRINHSQAQKIGLDLEESFFSKADEILR